MSHTMLVMGFNCLRLPFLWERLQPDLYGDYSPEEQHRLTAIVETITNRELVTVIDPHNYAKRRIKDDNWSTEYLIGSERVPTTAFTDFWKRLAELFKGDDRVIFGLMNEPDGITAADWLEIANRTIAAIRETGSRNLILVPGVAYTGAHSWMHSGNTAMAGVIDPANRFAIEVHQYFDGNSSGKSEIATSGSCGSDRLLEFQNWARQNNLNAFLGEFAGAENPTALTALADICQEMGANGNVWLGWTAWAAGPFWPEDYIFNLDPTPAGGTRKQTQLLANYAKPVSRDYWVRSGASIDLDLERGRCFGCRDPSEALSFDQPKIAHSGRRGIIRLRGSLQRLMKQSEFTLLIETRDLDMPPVNCDLLTASAGTLLQRTIDGNLRSPLGDGLWTWTQPLLNWKVKRRSAISGSVAKSRFSIATTGGGSATVQLNLPELTDIAISSGASGGSTVRVTGFAQFMEASRLEEICL